MSFLKTGTHYIGMPRTREDEIVVGRLDVAKIPSKREIQDLGGRWGGLTAPIYRLPSVLALWYHVLCDAQA